MSSFSGLYRMSSALNAHRAAMEIAGQNISNANDPSYTRRTVNNTESMLMIPAGASGQLLSGSVNATAVRMEQSRFLQTQLHMGLSDSGAWKTRSELLSSVEQLLGEPGDRSLSASMSAFFASWSHLSTQPDDSGARAVVLHQADVLAGQFNRLAINLQSQRSSLSDRIETRVSDLNDLGRQLASVNRLIEETRAAGQQPMDLLDRRDALLEEAAALTGAVVSGTGGMNDIILMDGQAWIQNGQARELTVVTQADGSIAFQLAGIPTAIRVSGELGAMATVHNTDIPAVQQQLDQMASALITRVNAVHQQGYGADGSTNLALYEGADAATIRLSVDLAGHPERLAAASALNAPGDGSNAQALAAVRTEALIGGRSLVQVWGGLTAQVGASVRQASANEAGYTEYAEALRTQKLSQTGVSLDEELTNMVRLQQSYSAAARVLTAMDEMLSTVIDRMGTVGR